MNAHQKETIATYIEGEIRDPQEIEQIENHLRSCPECRKWKATYEKLLQADDEANMIENVPQFQMTPALRTAIAEKATQQLAPEQIPPFRMTDKIRYAIGEHKPSEGFWAILREWVRAFQRPMVLGFAGLLLIAVAVFVIYRPHAPDVSVQIAGVTYQAWGDAELLSGLENLEETPPALQSPQLSQHLGFLTPTLVELLQRPKLDARFWQTLSQALARQKIQLPDATQTLVIEKNLLSAIRAGETGLDEAIRIWFYREKVVLIQSANGE